MDIEKLRSKKSILWSDATLYEDFVVISRLVDAIVVGDEKHKSRCVEKIILNIQTTAWQNKYPVRSFIFLIYYSFFAEVGDIKAMATCQTLEIIFYLKLGTQGKDNFKEKVKELYREFYSFDFQEDTANIIRIIRNNLAHAGTIDGIWEKYKPHDQAAVTDYLTAHSELSGIRLIAYSFNLLVNDIVIRILGLDFSDLDQNGLQPFNNKYFKV